MWVDATEKMLNKQTVLYKKEQIPLSKAESILSNLPEKDRYALYKELITAYKNCEPFAEAELNAIYTYKKLMDEKRGFKSSYSESLLSYEIDEKDAFTLIDLVTKHNSISKKFYTLHATLLGKKVLSYADRSVQIGSIKKQFTFDKAISLVGDAFEKVDKKYSELLHRFLNQGQIDVFPRSGKRNGGYCASTYGNPTFILLNHTEDLLSVETLAHEMGHAIHSELSKSQPAHYQQYSMPVAEVASTFFEHVLYESVFPTLSEKEQIIFLHNRILRDITTIFRQIACFQFEKDLHEAVRTTGQVPSSDIKKILVSRLSSYLGSAVDLTLDDALQYVGWPHIRSFFYVFSYAYGLLISKSLFEKWKNDPSYITEIETFLSAGGSMSPKDIFKKIGIDTSDPTFFEAGLKAIDADIKKLERLAKKAKMI
jgi:oligoendopeptidase F